MRINKLFRILVVSICVLGMVGQPIVQEAGASMPRNLSPALVSDDRPVTDERALFNASVVSDADFLSFALFTYGAVIEDKAGASELFKRLSRLPLWDHFRYRSFLARNFAKADGDILVISFKNAGIVRVIPKNTHNVLYNGAVADGIVPEKYYETDNYLVQYLSADASEKTRKIKPSHLRIWEKVVPYYAKARPADLVHISWMMLEAARISRSEGLDEDLLIPIVLLHDTGYANCLSSEKTRSFDRDVKRKHMAESAKIAREILEEVNYDPALRDRIVHYVSVHDNWRFGDNTPFRECTEMAVFQDLDFTWMASKEGFDLARRVTFGKTPRQMYDLLLSDEKHEKRPFATKSTKELFERLMSERKLEVEVAEASGENDREAPLNMIGFGPHLSYAALDIDEGTTGIYITVLERDHEMPKSTVRLGIMDEVDGWDRKKLLRAGFFTAASILEAGMARVAEVLGEARAVKVMAACGKPYYRKKLEFVCLAEEGSSERARQVAEMLNQGLYLINCAKDVFQEDNRYSKLVASHISEKASRLKNRKISVELATNLEANSTNYFNRIVFNKKFIDFLYDRWVHNRREKTGTSWWEEAGALVMLAERLFHEIDHDPDEYRQILNDLMFYKATLKDKKPLQDAVRLDVSFEVKVNGDDTRKPFGETFGTNAYYAMIHRIAGMNDPNEIRRHIMEYLESTYREFSSRKVLGLSDEKIAYAEKLMKEHGIEDDLFGEKIFGVDLEQFFARHCLYSSGWPYNHDWKDLDQRREWGRVYKWKISRIKEYLLATGRMVGSEEKTRRWIENRLKTTHITGRGSTKKKLYPIIKWAVSVRDPQNFQMRRGKLFGRIYHKGLNLMTLPILPVDEDGEIRWDLFRFDEEYSVWVASEGRNRVFRAPPKEYYKAKKISLYEYLVRHEVPPEEKKEELFPESPGKKKQEPAAAVQLSLFDPETLEPTFKVSPEKAEVNEKGEYKDNLKKSVEKVHELSVSADTSVTAGRVTHILIDRDIPAASQGRVVTYLSKRSRDRLAMEKVHFMSMEEMNAYLESNQCNAQNTVVFLEDTTQIDDLRGNVNMLVVEKEGVADFVNLEGLLGISRCMLNDDWSSFRRIYTEMTGLDCPQIKDEWLSDPALLARNVVLTLPPVSIIDIEHQKELNEMLTEMLVAA
ncbi:MAG: hypothetical protein GF409_07330 [Candidatus Omnitrophica bacterium]|nr:hypothetical protein [Candidatus Omnitrophota bacterium]